MSACFLDLGSLPLFSDLVAAFVEPSMSSFENEKVTDFLLDNGSLSSSVVFSEDAFLYASTFIYLLCATLQSFSFLEKLFFFIKSSFNSL